jgi:hypothetical protein
MTWQQFRFHIQSQGESMIDLESRSRIARIRSEYPPGTTGPRGSGQPMAFRHRGHSAPELTGRDLSIDDRFANRMAINSAASMRIGFDGLLRANEYAARSAFKATIQSISAPRLSEEFSRTLQRTLFRGLKKIGLDAELAADLLRISGSAWQMMIPYLNRKIAFHPKMLREIEAIRPALHQGAEVPTGVQHQSAGRSWNELQGSIAEFMAPENLQNLLNLIATPWIVLPRAYGDLKKNECRYLPLYLRMIDKNGDAEVNRVFIRIALELVANYSTKFKARRSSTVLLKNVVFLAYETMFWRCLRRPPDGFEDCRVFETLLNFLKQHARKWYPTSPAMLKAVLRMQTAKRLLFPQLLQACSPLVASRFLVTLRHGKTELQALLRYFENLPRLYRKASQNQPANLMLIMPVSELVKEVRLKYHRENHHTRQNIRQFFDCLKQLAADGAALKSAAATRPLDASTFVDLRLVSMIDRLDKEVFDRSA